MGTRVHVAASACVVASGLFMCGLGGALAFAEPAPPPRDPAATHSNELPGDPKKDDGKTDGPVKPDDTVKPGESTKPRDTTKPEQSTESESPTTQSPTTQSPTTQSPTTQSPTTERSVVTEYPEPCVGEGSNSKECTSTESTTTRSTTPTTTTPGVGFPGPGGGGSGSGGGGGIPSRWIQPPQMQLPPEAPTVVSAAPGLALAAGELPLAPITLPVIVAPIPIPVLAPGVGGGGGGPAGPANPALPPAPRAVAAEPPAARDTLPANVGSNAVVPAASYRVGYAEYLRTAGISQVAALAVPGLAGMLVLTGAGGLLGYRQARAGHAMRAARTARFVN